VKKVILFFAAVVLLAACKEESGLGPGPTHPQPTTPATCLTCVEVSFNQRDIGLLKAMLNESFVFYFNPEDVGQWLPGSGYVIPKSWTRAEFVRAASKILKSVYSVSLSIPTAGVGEPDPGAKTYKAEDINITLLVMIDERNGVLVERGYCDFAFGEYTGEDAHKYWHITEWRDWTYHWSLGRFLAMYH
jgi:hypothetical protein